MNHSPKSDVMIYTTRVCPYCIAAKHLMKARGIVYDEIDVTTDNAKRTWLAETTGRKTVPQIFISGAAVGGYDELAALDKSGRLAEMLAPGSAVGSFAVAQDDSKH